MVFQRFSLNTAFTKTFLCISRLVLCTASLGVISLSCSTTSSRITSTIPSVHATHTERSFAPGEYQRSVGYTHVQVQALSMVVDRGTSHMAPKVPASIIPFVLDNVTEARPADQVICRRNLAGTWGTSPRLIRWPRNLHGRRAKDSLNCPQRPLAFAFGQLLSCQTRPMKVRLVRGRGLEGQRARYVGVCAAAVNCAQLAR
mgnify:CR=1 FL=1